MAYRNDPSSLSFGRRMNSLEVHAANQAREIKELKKGQLSSEEKQSAKELAAAKRAERNRANQMLASYDTSLNDLDSLNESLLSSAQREQIRHNRNGLYAAQMNGPLVQFDDAALARLDNWKMSKAGSQQQAFTNNNFLPWDTKPQKPYDVWSARQDSPQGKYERHKKQQQQLERDVMIRRSELERSKTKPQGKRIGGLKDLND